MKPFDPPANHNADTPAVAYAGVAAFWLDWPAAACAASLDLAARQWEVWAATQRAALDMTARLWGRTPDAPADQPAPAAVLAAADVRAASIAVWRAQMDAVEALRRPAA